MRKSLRSLLALVAALPVCSVAYGQTAQRDAPQSFPNQVVRFIVPFSAGSGTDVLARTLAEKLTQDWGHPVIVENRPGITGAATVARAPADGHTLLLTSVGHTIVGTINKNLPFDPVKDFAGVTQVAVVSFVAVVPLSLQAKTLRDYIALAKDEPGKLSYGSAGVASSSFIAGELLKQAAGIDVVHVPFKGAPEAVRSVLRGDTQMFMSALNAAVELIQADKIRALAVTSATRAPILPDVPTIAEAGVPNFSFDGWFGVLARANTSPQIIEKVNQDIVRVLKMPDVVARLSRIGLEPASTTSDRFDQMLRSDTQRYDKLLKDAGIGTN